MTGWAFVVAFLLGGAICGVGVYLTLTADIERRLWLEERAARNVGLPRWPRPIRPPISHCRRIEPIYDERTDHGVG